METQQIYKTENQNTQTSYINPPSYIPTLQQCHVPPNPALEIRKKPLPILMPHRTPTLITTTNLIPILTFIIIIIIVQSIQTRRLGTMSPQRLHRHLARWPLGMYPVYKLT